MIPPRFQFTISGLLWATFWAAVSVAAWTAMPNPWTGAGLFKLLVVYTACIAAPSAAIGALFGQARLGFFVGAPWGAVWGIFMYFILSLPRV